ncbi:MAG TPA: hypothetical protein VFI47_02100 [Acidimicrobiales bacterium]|nr:hypothetical protein [Acidimicrobiales bacterium]
MSITYTELRAEGSPDPGAPPQVVPAARKRVCETFAAPGGREARSENQNLAPVPGGLVEGEWYYSSCKYVDTGELASSRYWQYTPGAPGGPGPDLGELADIAYDQIPLAFPVPRTSPAIEIRQITGLPTWLWVDGAWAPQIAEASLAGLTVTVTATPRHIVWDMGERDRSPLTCTGPGTPFVPELGDDQHTDCSYVYQWVSAAEPDGVYRASATMVWDVTWHASTGQTGVLAPASRTTTFDLTVAELQAVVCYDTPSDCPDADTPAA